MARIEADPAPEEAVKLQRDAGYLLQDLGRNAEAVQMFERGAELARSLGDRNLLVVHLGQDHLPRRGPDRGGHGSSARQRSDECTILREVAACQRIPEDAEGQLMLGLARLEERPTDIEERLDRVESARLDRHRVSRA